MGIINRNEGVVSVSNTYHLTYTLMSTFTHYDDKIKVRGHNTNDKEICGDRFGITKYHP